MVVKSSLAPFDCTKRGEVWTMDAEPSIVCGSATGPHRTLVTVAAVSIVLYVLGVPSIFLAILIRNRVQVGSHTML